MVRSKKLRPIYDDQERLKDAWQAGDREAMARAVLDISRSIIRAKADAIPWGLDPDDLAQEATVEAIENLDRKYLASKGTLRTFVYGSVRFTILDRSRKEIRRSARLKQAGDWSWATG